MTVDAIHVFALIILFGVAWRLASTHMAGTKLGAAMAFIY